MKDKVLVNKIKIYIILKQKNNLIKSLILKIEILVKYKFCMILLRKITNLDFTS